MWYFTIYGFFSVVCAFGEKRQPLVDTLMVRARLKAHLLNLQKRFPQVADYEIMTDAATDYKYRIVVPKSVWTSVAASLSNEISWSNFKSEVEMDATMIDSGYYDALHDVWRTMFDLQVGLPPYRPMWTPAKKVRKYRKPKAVK